MVDKDVLSQEEIDALLDAVDEGEAETSEGSSGNPQAQSEENQDGEAGDDIANESVMIQGVGIVKTLNFSAQERIVRGQLPVLDKIYDRAVRLFSADIYQIAARDFEIKQEPLLVIKHQEFMKSLANPSLMSVYKFKPLRGKGIILFDSVFIYDLVDYYFGGGSQFLAQKERTDFTATELKVMDVVFAKLTHNLTLAWEHVQHLVIEKVSDETNPQLVNIAEPDDMLLVAKFNLDFGKEIGTFCIALPYSMLEPIKQQLELGASRPDDEIDPNWIKSLREELMDVELSISASMGEAQSTLGKVMGMQVGDFIPIEFHEVVTLDIEGTPGFRATLGSANDKRALKIIDIIRYRG